MASSEYSIIRGGLKLKGSKPTGVTKTKKKKSSSAKKDKVQENPSEEISLQKALADEDSSTAKDKDGLGKELSEEELKQLDPTDGDGKTAAERQMEEMRRRRVCLSLSLPIHSFYSFPSFPFPPLVMQR